MDEHSGDQTPQSPGTARSAAWQLIDQLADEFEAAVRAGVQPQVAEWVGRVSESMREQLRIELQAVTDEYRLRAEDSAVVISGDAASDVRSSDEEDTIATDEATTRVQSVSSGPLHPTVIGGHRIIDLIGAGGMGVVYLARHEKLQRVVALKTFHAGLVATASEISRFRTEAGAAARLNHPGIVPVYECGEDQGLHYYTMLFVEGQTLQQLLKDTLLPVTRSAKLIMRAAEALEFAHSSGVIHRDIKPANIIIDTEDNPRIADFGLAKLNFEGSERTRTGMVMGTPAYMSPELALGQASEAGPGTDVYGIGALLYQCLTGRPPFQGNLDEDIRRQVIQDEPVRPRLLNRSIPKDLETICLKCLEKNPASRYSSAGILAEDLQRFLEHRPILARPVGRILRAIRWCRRKPQLATAWALSVSLLLMLSTGIPLLMLFSQRAATEETLRKQSDEVSEANARLAATQKYYAAIREVSESSLSREQGWTWNALRRLLEASESDADERDPTELRSLIARSLLATDARLLATFAELEFIRRMAFSHDGSMLATGDVYEAPELTVTVYQLTRHRDGFAEPVLAVTPIRRLKIPSRLDEILHWVMREAPGYAMPGISSVAFSPDGNRLAVANRAGRIFVWNLQSESRKPELRFQSERYFVEGLMFSADGRSLYGIATIDEKLHRWDGPTGKLLSVADQSSKRFSIIPGDPERQIAPSVVCGDRPLALLNPETLQQTRLLQPKAWGNPHASDPDQRVIAGMHDWSIVMVDLATGRIGRSMQEPDGIAVANYRRICLLNYGGTVTAAVEPGLVRNWDALSGHVQCDIDIDILSDIQLEAHDPSRMIMVATDRRVQAFQLRMPGSMKQHSGEHPDDMPSSEQHVQAIVDGVAASPMKLLPLGSDDVTRLVVSHDGQRVATSEASILDKWTYLRNEFDTQVFRIRELDQQTGREVNRWVFRSMKPTTYSTTDTGTSLSFVEGTEKIAAILPIPGELMLLDADGIQFFDGLPSQRFENSAAAISPESFEFVFPTIPEIPQAPVMTPKSKTERPIASEYQICIVLHASRAPQSDEESFSVELDLNGDKQTFVVDGSVLESGCWHLLQLDTASTAECRQAGNRIVIHCDSARINVQPTVTEALSASSQEDRSASAESAPLQVLIDRIILIPQAEESNRQPILSYVDAHADGSISLMLEKTDYVKWSADGSKVIDGWFDFFNAAPIISAKSVGSDTCVMGFWNGQVFMQKREQRPIKILGDLMADPGDTADEPLAATMTVDDHLAAVGCRSGTVKIFDLNRSSNWLIGQHAAHRRSVTAIAISRDKSLIATASDDGKLSLWAHESGTLTPLMHLEHLDNAVSSLEFSPDNRQLLFVCQKERGLRQIDLELLNRVFTRFKVQW